MKKRILARIDIKRDKLIKGVHLEGLGLLETLMNTLRIIVKVLMKFCY